MEADKSFFKESQQLIEEYIRERLLLLKLQTAERTAGIVSTLLVSLIIGLLSFLILFFISVTGAYFFIQLTGSWYLGLSIMVLIFAFVLLVVYVKRKALNKYFSDMIVSLFFSDSTDFDHEDTGKL